MTARHLCGAALALALLSRPLAAQRSIDELLALAESAINGRHLDSAASLLQSALDASSDTLERVPVLVWIAAWHSVSGRDGPAREHLRLALRLSAGRGIGVSDERLPRRVIDILNEERQQLELLASTVMTPNTVEVQPARLSGPPVKYPPDAWRRRVSGRAVIDGIVGTDGRFEPASLRIEVPDSALLEPVRAAMLETRFSPGRYRGEAVRSYARLAIVLQPGPPPNPTTLVTEARARLAAGHADSALALVDFALDPQVRATPGVHAYALLVRGIAFSRLGRDSVARASFDAGLAGYDDLRRAGVDLAPVLRRLADSVRAATRGPAARSRPGAPSTVESVDQQPVLVSYPPIDYPPEMRALRAGGLVVVEVTIDTAGVPLAAGARVVQTANPGLDQAALRVVAGSRYRPARRGGKPVRVVIRQPITFSP